MKKYCTGGILVMIVCLFQSCMKDTLKTTYTSFEPIYQTKNEVLNSISSSAALPLVNTGKLALYGHYLFVNEVNKGVHIIDNADPAHPINKYFIRIPGNLDVAVKNNVLYADVFEDLVSIDISDPNHVQLKNVQWHVFPERSYGTGFTGDTSRYIVDWVKHSFTQQSDIDQALWYEDRGIWLSDAYMNGANGIPTTANGIPTTTNSNSGGTQSISGSMARFTIVSNTLYTVSNASLMSFDITQPAQPVMLSSTSLGWNIETIYPLKNKLFIGSQTGMFIFNIDNPAAPLREGNFSHACFNDPVIANDHYAFITLRAMESVSPCWGVAPQSNELDIVDINNLNQPVLTKVYNMTAPQGLSLDGNHLFICDGRGGLKLYDASDVTNLRLLHTVTDINPFDVIAYNQVAVVVAKEGISQYDYSDVNHIKKLSTIGKE